LPLRDVVERELFTERCAELGLDARALDEVLFALKWVLARDPEFWPRIPGYRERMARTRASARIPALRVYYLGDAGDHEVHLLWAQVREPESG
jgi:hypothetical protein